MLAHFVKTSNRVGLLPLLALASCATKPNVTRITVFTGTWFISFTADGRAAAQYGSLIGDSGYVEDNTVDFKRLLKGILNTPRKERMETGDQFQVAIPIEGATSTPSFTLTDESRIRRELSTLDAKWKQHPLGTRFFELKKEFPIISSSEIGNE